MKKIVIPMAGVLALALALFANGVPQNKKTDTGKDVKAIEYVAQTYGAKEAKVGDYVVCPVMGTKFQVKDNSIFVEVKGKKYFVCCNMCPAPLKKNPDKYLADPKAASKADKSSVENEGHSGHQH